MKNTFLVLMTTLLSVNVAFASDINVGIKGVKYQQYTSILQSQVDWAEDTLDEYIEEALGCSKVRFALDVVDEPGIFSKGLYNLNLTAKCTETFSDFKFDFYHGYDEDYTTLDITYKKDGKISKKGFKSRMFY